ncbi:MAG: cation:proton antiporter [Phycisphaerales bacterium]|nr:MAG: cation:proton antiporter [Phycisphaerales bacterium]
MPMGAAHAACVLGSATAPALVEPGFLLGLMLLAAFFGAVIARTLRIPRVVGFLAAGVLLKQSIVGAAVRGSGATWSQALERATAAARPLDGLTDLALGLILFFIGAVFEKAHIKSVGPRALRVGAMEMGLTLALVAVLCGAAAALTDDWSPSEVLALGVLLGIAAIATAPAATLLVLREYEAKGPMTDMVLTLTGINNIVSIVLFHVAFLLLASTGVIATQPDPEQVLPLDLFLSTLGSVMLGLILGTALSWFHVRNNVAETLLVFLAVLLALGAGRDWLDEKLNLSFSFLLTSLTIGAVFSNVAVNPERLSKGLALIGGPLFAAFFVKAGYELHLEDLPSLGWLGAVYISARVVGKLWGAYYGGRWARLTPLIKPYMGVALLCQAGVVIGLGTFLVGKWGYVERGVFVPAAGASAFYTVILGSVAVFELFGPLLIKQAVVYGGEVKAVQLWTHREVAAAGTASPAALILGSLANLLGLHHAVARAADKDLRARHLMRTNIKLLHDADTFDEVMHFVERSRFNHFPVVDDDEKLTGMIHYSDLRDIIYDPAMRDLVTAADMADIDAPYLTVEQTLPEVMDKFTRTEYDALPVIDSEDRRKVVGQIEQRDVIRLAGDRKANSGT